MGAAVFWLTAFSLMWGALLPATAGEAWKGEALPLRRIDVHVDNAYPDDLDWQALAGALIDLHLQTDRQLTQAGLDQAREALAAFGRVESTVSIADGHADLSLELTPFRRIQSIRVEGNAPLFDQDVLNAMQVAPGDVFRAEVMQAQQDLVAQRFLAEGYVSPKVKISWEADAEDGHYRLCVTIDKGPAYVLSEVRLMGAKAVPEADLKRHLSTFSFSALWGGRPRFKPRQIKEDVRSLIDYYRRQGYAEVDVHSDTTLDPQRASARVVFTIDEGPRTDLVFSGNTVFSDTALRKEVPLIDIGNRGNRGVRRGVQAIRRRYLAAGYADVQVRWQAESVQTAEGIRRVLISIGEGVFQRVDTVVLTGNRRLDTPTLMRRLLTRPSVTTGGGAYVEEVLEEDLAAVKAFYLRHGFLSMRVDKAVHVDPATGATQVTLAIEEGPQTLVGKVRLAGSPPPEIDNLMAQVEVKPGQPFERQRVDEECNRLSAAIAPLGYPHVQVRGDVTFSPDQDRADVVYYIDPGPLVQVGRIFFTGHFRTRDALLRHELELAPGDPFNLEKILAAQKELRNLRVFDSVQVRSVGLKEKNTTVPLLVSLREKKPYYFESGAGYQSDKGVYGRGKVGDRNLFGTAKNGWLSGELSEVGWLAQAGLSEPRFFGTRFSADSGLFVQHDTPFNQEFGTDTVGATLTISRNWSARLTTALGLRFEQREQFLRDGETTATTDPETLDPRAIVVTTPSVRWDDRDSFIRPRQGRIVTLAVDISKGLDNALDDFLKYRFDGRAFHSPAEHLVLAARIGVGYLHPYGDGGQIPQDQLLFLGGTNSVRGFGENQLRQDGGQTAVGGRLTLMGSLEARYEMSRNWEACFFLDGGSVRQTVADEGSDEWRWAAGLGLGYLTPIGPLGFFYGHKLDRREGESAGQWHLSIGYTF